MHALWLHLSLESEGKKEIFASIVRFIELSKKIFFFLYNFFAAVFANHFRFYYDIHVLAKEKSQQKSRILAFFDLPFRLHTKIQGINANISFYSFSLTLTFRPTTNTEQKNVLVFIFFDSHIYRNRKRERNFCNTKNITCRSLFFWGWGLRKQKRSADKKNLNVASYPDDSLAATVKKKRITRVCYISD